MTGVEIEIFIYSENELKLKDLDIELNESEDLLEKRTFWRIDYAMRNKENLEETVFFIADESFVTPMKYEDFVKLLNK